MKHVGHIQLYTNKHVEYIECSFPMEYIGCTECIVDTSFRSCRHETEGVPNDYMTWVMKVALILDAGDGLDFAKT